MAPKKGKGKGGPVDGVDTTSMSREQLEAFSLRLREELDREREERNFFQLERDKLRTFWEITRQQLEENRAQLRNQDRAQDENEEKHQAEIKVYKQKVKHLLYEHQCNLSELKVESMVSLKMAQDEYTAMEQQLLQDKKELKEKLREQELAHQEEMRQLKMEHSSEVSKLREQFSQDSSELERKYETRLQCQIEELGMQHAMELGEVEQRKNRQVVELTKSHEQAFNDMKNYYNDITLNNLALISSLKEQMEELKSSHERMEKQLRDVQGTNKRLLEPLTQARAELANLQRQLASYEQDKITLANTKQRLALVTKELEELKWENEVLEIRFEKVEKERDRLHAEFVGAVLDVQQKSGLKSAVLEKKMMGLRGGVSERWKSPRTPLDHPPPHPNPARSANRWTTQLKSSRTHPEILHKIEAALHRAGSLSFSSRRSPKPQIFTPSKREQVEQWIANSVSGSSDESSCSCVDIPKSVSLFEFKEKDFIYGKSIADTMKYSLNPLEKSLSSRDSAVKRKCKRRCKKCRQDHSKHPLSLPCEMDQQSHIKGWLSKHSMELTSVESLSRSHSDGSSQDSQDSPSESIMKPGQSLTIHGRMDFSEDDYQNPSAKTRHQSHRKYQSFHPPTKNVNWNMGLHSKVRVRPYHQKLGGGTSVQLKLNKHPSALEVKLSRAMIKLPISIQNTISLSAARLRVSNESSEYENVRKENNSHLSGNNSDRDIYINLRDGEVVSQPELIADPSYSLKTNPLDKREEMFVCAHEKEICPEIVCLGNISRESQPTISLSALKNKQELQSICMEDNVAEESSIHMSYLEEKSTGDFPQNLSNIKVGNTQIVSMGKECFSVGSNVEPECYFSSISDQSYYPPSALEQESAKAYLKLLVEDLCQDLERKCKNSSGSTKGDIVSAYNFPSEYSGDTELVFLEKSDQFCKPQGLLTSANQKQGIFPTLCRKTDCTRSNSMKLSPDPQNLRTTHMVSSSVQVNPNTVTKKTSIENTTGRQLLEVQTSPLHLHATTVLARESHTTVAGRSSSGRSYLEVKGDRTSVTFACSEVALQCQVVETTDQGVATHDRQSMASFISDPSLGSFSSLPGEMDLSCVHPAPLWSSESLTRSSLKRTASQCTLPAAFVSDSVSFHSLPDYVKSFSEFSGEKLLPLVEDAEEIAFPGANRSKSEDDYTSSCDGMPRGTPSNKDSLYKSDQNLPSTSKKNTDSKSSCSHRVAKCLVEVRSDNTSSTSNSSSGSVPTFSHACLSVATSKRRLAPETSENANSAKIIRPLNVTTSTSDLSQDDSQSTSKTQRLYMKQDWHARCYSSSSKSDSTLSGCRPSSRDRSLDLKSLSRTGIPKSEHTVLRKSRGHAPEDEHSPESGNLLRSRGWSPKNDHKNDYTPARKSRSRSRAKSPSLLKIQSPCRVISQANLRISSSHSVKSLHSCPSRNKSNDIISDVAGPAKSCASLHSSFSKRTQKQSQLSVHFDLGLTDSQSESVSPKSQSSRSGRPKEDSASSTSGESLARRSPRISISKSRSSTLGGGARRLAKVEVGKRPRCRSEGRPGSPIPSSSYLHHDEPHSANRHLRCYGFDERRILPPIPVHTPCRMRASSASPSGASRRDTHSSKTTTQRKVAATEKGKTTKQKAGKTTTKKMRRPHKEGNPTSKRCVTQAHQDSSSVEDVSKLSEGSALSSVSLESTPNPTRPVIWTKPDSRAVESEVTGPVGSMWLRFPGKKGRVGGERESVGGSRTEQPGTSSDDATGGTEPVICLGSATGIHQPCAPVEQPKTDSSTESDRAGDVSFQGSNSSIALVTFPPTVAGRTSSSSHIFWKGSKSIISIEEIFSDDVLFQEEPTWSPSMGVVASKLSCLREETDSDMMLESFRKGAEDDASPACSSSLLPADSPDRPKPVPSTGSSPRAILRRQMSSLSLAEDSRAEDDKDMVRTFPGKLAGPTVPGLKTPLLSQEGLAPCQAEKLRREAWYRGASHGSRAQKVRFSEDVTWPTEILPSVAPREKPWGDLKSVIKGNLQSLHESTKPVVSRSLESVKPTQLKFSTTSATAVLGKVWTLDASERLETTQPEVRSKNPAKILVSRAKSTASLTGIHERPATCAVSPTGSVGRILRPSRPGKDVMVVELFRKRSSGDEPEDATLSDASTSSSH